MPDISPAVMHQAFSAMSRQVTQLGAAVPILGLNVLIQMSEFPKRTQPKEELLDFGLVAVDAAVALQELVAQKRGAADRYN